MLKVRKVDGRLEKWNPKKIGDGIVLAGYKGEVAPILSEVVERVLREAEPRSRDQELSAPVSTEIIGNIVEEVLINAGFPDVARRFIRYRELKKGKKLPKMELLSRFVEVSKYVRADLGESTWDEAVDRLMDMYEDNNIVSRDTLTEIKELIKAKKILPSMRSLQFGGQAIKVNNNRLYNCCATIVTDWDKVAEIFYLLLCGCGVGFRLIEGFRLPGPGGRDHYTIEDSIEGWADAVKVLGRNVNVTFNYSKIRARGTPLKTSGGVAPGHWDLMAGLEKVRGILKKVGERKLKRIEIYDIICHLAQIVVSGGIRRSSLICLFDGNDEELLYAKYGDWWQEHGHRSICNNSVVVKGDLSYYCELNAKNGEPGFFFPESPGPGPAATNPCGEIKLFPGTGFQFCNLTEVVDVSDDRHFELATLLGMMQAQYDNHKYIREWGGDGKLLGVSITNICGQEPFKGWIRELLLKGDKDRFERVLGKYLRDKYSIIRSLAPKHTYPRVTCIKPSGTASLVAGVHCAGIHPAHSKFYWRRMKYGEEEWAVKKLLEVNPELIGGPGILKWPCYAGDDITIDELNGINHLMLIRVFRDYWCDHNVSASVVVPNAPDPAIYDYIIKHKLTVTLIPYGIEDIYPNAPRERVRNFGEYFNVSQALREVDYGGNEKGSRYSYFGSACEGLLCEFKNLEG